MRASTLLIVVALVAAQTLFVLAVVVSFTPLQLARAMFNPAEMVLVNVMAGLAETAVGYESAVLFGGRLSIGVGEGMSRLMGSKYVVEEVEEPSSLSEMFVRNSFLIYEPMLVFIMTVAIAWDLFNLDSFHAGAARPLVHLLNIFSRPLGTNTVLYSLEITPYVVFFSFLAGIVPSIALPYIRRLKVTGVNSGPFHTTLLISLVGLVAGLSVVSTLLGLFYQVLVLDRLPTYYRYALLLAAGLALCYVVGNFMGLKRSEDMVKSGLERGKERGVFEGSVTLTRRNADGAET